MSSKRNKSHATVTREADGYKLKINVRPESASRQTYIADWYDHNNKRIRRRLGTDDLDAAIETAQQMVIDLPLPGTVRDPGQNPTLISLKDFYLQTWMPNRGRKPKSIQDATNTLNDFQMFCGHRNTGRIQQISISTIEDFKRHLREIGNSSTTIRKKITTLRSMFNAAVQAEHIPASPVTRWHLPKADPVEITWLEPEELAPALAAVSEHEPLIYDVICWLAFTGQRPSDAIDLRVKQVDLSRRICQRLQIKTSALATFPLSPDACAAVERALAGRTVTPDSLVFPAPDGKTWESKRLPRAFQRALHAAEHPRAASLTLYNLRHTFAYIHANIINTPLPILQQMMGHSDVKMTMRYVKPGNGVAFADKFTELLKSQATTGCTPTKKRKTKA